jgi:poly(hydroxyalkanoate) granule-associated protein
MVTRVKAVTETQPEEAEHRPMVEMVRKVLLASIGAVALAQDELENFVNKLVERGELAEQDGKKLVREMVEKRRKQAEHAEAEVDKRTEDLLARMNVPTKADIDALSAKITALGKKVDELRKPTGTP